MNELFATLFLKLEELGDVAEANLYKSGDFSTIKVKTEDGTFNISISREKENGTVRD